MRRLVLLAILTAPGVLLGEEGPRWQKLPSLPDREGFAGSFVGVSGGALLVAGGANFPGKKPWEAGTKVWYDQVFVLEQADGKWRRGGRLPRPLGYGVSVPTEEGILCIGGCDAKRHYADCFLLSWRDGKVTTREMPTLPVPCAYLCGAKVGSVVHVAGGTEKPDSTSCLARFWSLDLSARKPSWKEEKPWPGPARMLGVAGAAEGAFFLFSGVDLSPGKAGEPVRKYLPDAYRFDPGKGWRKLADLPRPTVAAPSPATLFRGQLLVVSGDHGRNVDFKPISKHPGFPRGILAFDVRRGEWKALGESPLSRVAVSTASWRGRVVFPGGETRPGFRSPEVWGLTLP